MKLEIYISNRPEILMNNKFEGRIVNLFLNSCIILFHETALLIAKINIYTHKNIYENTCEVMKIFK